MISTISALEINSTEGEKVLTPGEEKSENTDKIDKEDSESKKQTEIKPEPEIKEEQPDIEEEKKNKIYLAKLKKLKMIKLKTNLKIKAIMKTSKKLLIL